MMSLTAKILFGRHSECTSLDSVCIHLTLIHVCGVRADPEKLCQMRIRLLLQWSLGLHINLPSMESRLFIFCEYVEENTLGSLKTPECVSVSNFVHVK